MPRGRRQGSVAPLDKGSSCRRWLIRISTGKDPLTGKYARLNRVVHGTKGAAEAALRELLQKQDGGFSIKRHKETLWDWLERSLDGSADLAPQTLYRMRESFRLYLTPALRAAKLDQLTAGMIQAHYQDLLTAGRSPTTIAILHRALRSQLNRAVELGLLARSPMDGVKSPRLVHQERPTLSPDQSRAFLAGVEPDRLGGLFSLMLLTGLRPEEALGLKWEDLEGKIEDGSQVLQVRRALVWLPDQPWSLEPTKGKRARRIRLSVLAQRVLQRHKRRQTTERVKLGPDYTDLGLMFTTQLGTPLHWTNASRAFRQILVRLKLPPMPPYSLRHSFATLALGNGESPKMIQEILGHATISITLDVYAHCTPDMQDRAAARMDALLGPAGPAGKAIGNG